MDMKRSFAANHHVATYASPARPVANLDECGVSHSLQQIQRNFHQLMIKPIAFPNRPKHQHPIMPVYMVQCVFQKCLGGPIPFFGGAEFGNVYFGLPGGLASFAFNRKPGFANHQIMGGTVGRCHHDFILGPTGNLKRFFDKSLKKHALRWQSRVNSMVHSNELLHILQEFISERLFGRHGAYYRTGLGKGNSN
jgi:hypothetical protein